MSYLVLARKYRPRTFDEVVGQSHVTATLANAISSGRVGHAYLFSGPRGVGKTTTARLLAKSLNCPNAKGASACDECDVCREVTAGISLDVIEIDAASNRGIDEIRNLRENVKYAPAGGKFKVYVVDEVHMLTDAAFNALLKTLEEPPAHVKFVLATTAPLKVPETILSRCQRFEFVRIPTGSIFERIKDICSSEGFKVSDDVLMLLSRRANGSLRDAESMLDQLVSSGLQEADESTVARLLGLSGAESFFSIMDAVRDGEARKALESLGELFDRGTNLDEFVDSFMEHLRNLLLIKIHPDLASLVEASKGHMARYQEQAKRFTEGDLLRLINLLTRASDSVRKSELPRLHLETAIVEMAYLDSTTQVTQLLERLDRLEANVRSGYATGGGEAGGGGKAASDAAAGARKTPRPDEHSKRVLSEPEAKEQKKEKGEGNETERETQRVEEGDTEREPETDRNSQKGKGKAGKRAADAGADTGKEGGTGRRTSVRVRKPQPETGPEMTRETREKWKEILRRLNSRKKTLGVCLSSAEFRGIFQGRVILGFELEKSFEKGFVESKGNRTLLKEELADVFKVALGVSCVEIDSRLAKSIDDVELESFAAEVHSEGDDASQEADVLVEETGSDEEWKPREHSASRPAEADTEEDTAADAGDGVEADGKESTAPDVDVDGDTDTEEEDGDPVKTIIDFFDGEIIEKEDDKP
ncbi:MAG: DNA polymerase III subunit gamma/tau [Candidatus Eiseniibacteriota bacterium]|nr:MAG: DNA polymerase III subunit gamma/tau [Candidatus Eisenbacteria bacterium]